MKYELELDMQDNNALQKIISQIKDNSMVLEFGPANGRMTKYLKEQLHCSVYIVEIDPDAAADALRYSSDGIIGDIEQYDWLEKWSSLSFDYITFADVLEHLRNPGAVLKQAGKLLKESGKVLMSVPNVAHNSIMISSYLNIFNYTPLGLLDDTHIHLFAYNSLVKLCTDADLIPIIEDATYCNVGENEIDAQYELVPIDVQKIFRNKLYGNVYQFVFTLQKKWYLDTHENVISKRIITVPPQYHFKVYLDMGNSWREENCYDYLITPGKEFTCEMVLSNFKQINRIRIDALNCNGVFQINKAELSAADKHVPLKPTEAAFHTGLIILENIQIDCSNDPQLIFAKDKWAEDMAGFDSATLSVSILYLDYSMNRINEITEAVIRPYEEKSNLIIEQESVIDQQIQQLRAFEKELEEKSRIIQEKDDLIQNMNKKLQKSEKAIQDMKYLASETETAHKEEILKIKEMPLRDLIRRKF